MAAKKEGYTDKLVRLPDQLWSALEEDATRCKRTMPKQLEALLGALYETASVELRNIEQARAATSLPHATHNDSHRTEYEVVIHSPSADEARRSKTGA